VDYAFGRQNWFDAHAREHQATRQDVALFDQSSFAKLKVTGRDACALMQHVCGNNTDVPAGKAVYTGMFNQHGGFESDFTAVRLSENEYYIITASTQGVHDANWIQRNTPAGMRVSVTDVTQGNGVLSVMGPQARAFLQPLTDTDLSDETFPFGYSKVLSLGMTTVRALRISYVGELGWELHVGMDQMRALYDTLMQRSEALPIVHAGHYAINSLRLEKGFRAWGAELSPDDNPVEAGLGFAVDWEKSQCFIGQERLQQIRSVTPRKRMAILTLQDPEPVLWGGEIIYRNGAVVGYTTSGSYGHTMGAAIAMGYVRHPDGVDRAFVREGEYAIKIGSKVVPAQVHLKAPVGS